jgi:hypothetical protein
VAIGRHVVNALTILHVSGATLLLVVSALQRVSTAPTTALQHTLAVCICILYPDVLSSHLELLLQLAALS